MNEWIKIIGVAVASVVTKELLTWLVSVIKKRNLKTTIAAKVNEWLAPYTSVIINHVFYLAITSLGLRTVIRAPEPVTRIEVAYIAFWVGFVLYYSWSLVEDISKLILYRVAQRAPHQESLAEQQDKLLTEGGVMIEEHPQAKRSKSRTRATGQPLQRSPDSEIHPPQ